jgi:hypothetical protein
LENPEIGKIIRNTIQKSSKEFEILILNSPLIQTKIPLGYLYKIQNGLGIGLLFGAGTVLVVAIAPIIGLVAGFASLFSDFSGWTKAAAFIGLPLLYTILWPMIVILSPLLILMNFAQGVAYFTPEQNQKSKLEGLLSQINADDCAKIFIKEAIKPFIELMEESKLNYLKKLRLSKNIPINFVIQKIQKIIKNAYLNTHELLFNFNFPNFKLNQVNCLGGGSYGCVWKEIINDQTFAVKILNDDDVEKTFSEMLGNRVSHPYLTKTFYYSKVIARSYDKENRKFSSEKEFPCVFMEYLDGKPLDPKVFTKLSFQEKIQFFLQMSIALEFLHSKQMFHRDIKPENILMTKQKEESPKEKKIINRDVIKFIDFGTTKPVNKSEGTLLGTPIYMAPEILSQIFKSKEKKSEKYDFSCDIFSLGLTFAELWEGKMAEREDSNYLKVQINLDKHKDEEGFKIIVEMIEGCCKFSPSDRLKIGKIVETLNSLIQKN